MTAQVFQEHRAFLTAIAYRLLGSVAEAEDAVQDTFLRWQGRAVETIETPRAWLTTTLTRLCLDQLRSARRKRVDYVGIWLPEPLVSSASSAPVDTLVDSLSMAFMFMLEKLPPAERVVYVLRQAFDTDYGEIAEMLGKSEQNCRQLFSRARKRFGELRREAEPASEMAEEVVRQFFVTASTGDFAGLVSLLSDDVVAYADGGGKVVAAGKPVVGAALVSKFFINVAKLGSANSRVEPVLVNGRPGAIVFADGRIVSVFAFAMRRGRIATIFVVRNPDKIQRLSPVRGRGVVRSTGN